jgi:hypothetical protein
MYAGIDFDTKAVHIVLVPEEGSPQYIPCVMEGHDAFERTRVVRDVMPGRGWWRDVGVIACGIEEPMGRGSVVQKLNVVQGAILACLPGELLVNPMRPSVWRTAVGLAGNATKETVALFVGACVWPDAPLPVKPASTWPQDACDAYCLALAVQKLTEPVAA